MIDNQFIQQKLEQAYEGIQVSVTGDGSHFALEASGPMFEGLSRIKQQQLIYSILNDQIKDGSIHALTIKIV